MRKNHFTVATAESCTGGLISKYLTDVSGSSSYIKLDVVTYSNQAKEKILKVNSHTLSEKGAVSEEVAKQMAEGIKKLAETDYAISTTGIAGPTGGSEEKPVGLVYIGIAGKKNTYVLKKIIHQDFRDMKSEKEQLLMPCTFSEKLYSVK